jgi:hypothetical protein
MLYSIKELLVLAAVFSETLATPTPTRTLQKRSFKHVVRRAPIDKTHPMAGPDAMLKAYKKFGFNIQSRQAAPAPPANGSASAGKVGAIPEPNAAEYLSPVTIGGQTLNLDFDTGSSDLYVILRNC